MLAMHQACRPRLVRSLPGACLTPWHGSLKRCTLVRGRQQVSVRAARDAYEVLGVPRTASTADVKRAYRKRALKLHPDVNKAPDAKERFMECKNAYQMLLEQQGGGGRRGSRASSSGQGSSAGGGWGDAWGGFMPGAGTGQKRPPGKQEEFYGFGDFVVDAAAAVREGLASIAARTGLEDLMRDLDKEFAEYSRRRAAAGGAAAGPKSLWEELNDIGEELVDYLEKELGLTDDDGPGTADRGADVYDRYKAQYGNPPASSSSSGGGASEAKRGPGGSAGAGERPGGRGPSGSSSNSSSGSSSSSSSSTGSGRAARPAGDRGGGASPPPPQKSRKEAIDDDLAELKRKMGLK